uniref:Taste receptor type 2 n=1 Tax=Terrapene triunguis TaxID=2587831 RepID=A0A674IKT4_9SAUR
MITVFKYIKGCYKEQGEKLLFLTSEDRTRSKGLKLQQGRFRLDIRKNFLTVRVVKHWNKLPREVVESPSLGIFKSRLDKHLISMIISVSEFLIGIIGNGLIVAVNYSDWVKRGKLSSCDLILTSLSITRFCLQCQLMVGILLYVTPSLKSSSQRKLYKIMNIFWMFLNHSSVWFATLLSVFFCLKIANFTQPLFLWLKLRISGLVPWLVLGTLVTSLLPTVPLAYNKTLPETALRRTIIVISLCRHTRQMQYNTIGLSSVSIEAHIRAIKAVITFLIVCISYFLAVHIMLSYIFIGNPLIFIISVVVMAAYPSGHTIVLILANPKLKKQVPQILHYASVSRVRMSSTLTSGGELWRVWKRTPGADLVCIGTPTRLA